MARPDSKASAIKLVVFDDDDANATAAADQSDPDVYSDRAKNGTAKARSGRLLQVAAEFQRTGVTLSRTPANSTKSSLQGDLQAFLLAKLKAELLLPAYTGKTDAEAAAILNLQVGQAIPRWVELTYGLPYAPNAVDAADVTAAKAS